MPHTHQQLAAELLASFSADQRAQLLELVGTMAAEPTPAAKASPYFTVAEAATYCRVAVRTIYNNRRFIERMPGVRKLLFRREALDHWLATRKTRKR